jgi:hypothetical protein
MLDVGSLLISVARSVPPAWIIRSEVFRAGGQQELNREDSILANRLVANVLPY